MFFNYIILLTGQSNALGVGGQYDQMCIDDQPDPRIWGYVSSNNYWTVFDLRIQVGSKKPGYQCIAFHFAKKILIKNPSWKIGIIVCALSNQSITRWIHPFTCKCADEHLQKGEHSAIDTGDIFNWSLLMSDLAIGQTSNTKINLFMWHQGEADHMESLCWYYQRLAKMLKQYRKNDLFSKCQVICAQLYENKSTSKMNDVFKTELNWIFLKLIQKSTDNVHYSHFSFPTEIKIKW
tara:strand:- start:3081 stop:3788 length:708 start_codon:yes stop_codon:yes gene_type:complete